MEVLHKNFAKGISHFPKAFNALFLPFKNKKIKLNILNH